MVSCGCQDMLSVYREGMRSIIWWNCLEGLITILYRWSRGEKLCQMPPRSQLLIPQRVKAAFTGSYMWFPGWPTEEAGRWWIWEDGNCIAYPQRKTIEGWKILSSTFAAGHRSEMDQKVLIDTGLSRVGMKIMIADFPIEGRFAARRKSWRCEVLTPAGPGC